jgi:hypothetical protein
VICSGQMVAATASNSVRRVKILHTYMTAAATRRYCTKLCTNLKNLLRAVGRCAAPSLAIGRMYS